MKGVIKDIQILEAQRLALQFALDAKRSRQERNKLGQFATPPALAADILTYAKALLPEHLGVRYLEPAIGTGSFYSALLKAFPGTQLTKAVGYEVDPYYGAEALKLWQETPLELHLGDFTEADPPQSEAEKFNLLITNPPYVRHHHLPKESKVRLQAKVEALTGIRLSQLTGLYCHFLLLAHAWLQEGGLAGWLIPSEFMDVNYGRQVKKYLLEQVTVLRVHRFDAQDTQFADALVSSAVVWLKKQRPPADHVIDFTYGGTLTSPRLLQRLPTGELRHMPKWTQLNLQGRNRSAEAHVRVKDLFDIRRGIATGDNAFFILSEEEVTRNHLPRECLRPVLPSPRFFKADRIEADELGEPLLDQKLYLVSCSLSEEAVKERYPALWQYLQCGKERGVHERYLCKSRTPWYAQEHRQAAPFLCPYMGRSRHETATPFRFILNHSNATAANAYLMLYPKGKLKVMFEQDGALKEHVWQLLNEISLPTLMNEGRVYGGGLHKLEPKELANAPIDHIAELIAYSPTRSTQPQLFEAVTI